MYEGVLKNNYLYNEKEIFDDADLNWYDYGFRNYDPQIGRFTQLDPLTHDYPYLTPFQYASCDPITNIDIDGLEGGSAVGVVIGGIGKGITEAAEHGGAVKDLLGVVVKASYAVNNATKGLSLALSAGNFIQIARVAISIINSNPATIPAGNNMPVIDNTAINKRNYVVNQMTGKNTSKLRGGKVFTGEDGGNEGPKGEVDDGDGDPTNIDGLGPAIGGIAKLAHPPKWFEATLTAFEGAHELHKEGLLGEDNSHKSKKYDAHGNTIYNAEKKPVIKVEPPKYLEGKNPGWGDGDTLEIRSPASRGDEPDTIILVPHIDSTRKIHRKGKRY